MSLTLKLSSLFIRTAAKPIGNWIKSQAREHERFRKICVGFAQSLHRIDMRLRLGLLQDSAAIERQIAREAAEVEAKRKQSTIPTVKTEAQSKAEEVSAAKEKGKIADKVKSAARPRIRPLSESKAIDSGANFISETFLFLVAGGLIVFETLRSRRKESNRREDVADRLASIESELESVKAERDASDRQLLELKTAVEKYSSSTGTTKSSSVSLNEPTKESKQLKDAVKQNLLSQ